MIAILLATTIAATNPTNGAAQCYEARATERCGADDLAAADRDLNRYYAAAVERLRDGDEKAAMVALHASQRAWLAYRDTEMAAVGASWGMGSVRGAMETAAATEITRQRIKAIWRQWLTFADSTPSILPEPRE